MRKTLLSLMLATLVAASVSIASALPVPLEFKINEDLTTVDLSNEDLDGWCPWITADIAVFDVDNPPAFSLGVGETQEIDFIDFKVGGFGGGTFDIAATLAFSTPVGATRTGSGTGWFGTVFGALSAGGLTWANPVQTLSLVDGTSLTVEFENICTWGLGNSTTLQAYVTNNGGTAPVPEPATMLLFGTGLVGLVGSRLRKKKK